MQRDDLNHNVFKNAMEAFANEKGRQLNTKGMLSFLRDGSTLIVAPLRAFDTSPATELEHGVDSAFAYVDSPARGVPAGFYTLRISARTVRIGEVPGTLDFVDAEGKSVKSSPIVIDITSLTVPQPPAFPHAVASIRSQDLHAPAGAITSLETVIVCCPNGYCWFERN